MRKQLWLVCFAVLVSLAPAFALASGAADTRRPNVILIVSDDQGYRDLGCFGSTEARTPHLDRLAEGGVRLSSFYVTWPACTPSRASLLTGRYPQRNGTYDMIRNDMVDLGHQYSPEEYAVSPERILGTDVREVFISDVLAADGYYNGVFGKWDGGQLLRYLPLQRGFHTFYGFTNTGIDYFTHERYGIPSMRRGNQLTTEDKGTYCTELFRGEAVRFLEEAYSRRLDADAERPFFLYLPFNAPHGASNLDRSVRGTVQAPEEYLALYPEGESRPQQRRRGYLAAITCMDDAIGQILDWLDGHGLADETIVIFFSDNGGGGGSDNGPLSGGKSRMFEGGIRVPAIIRWPTKIPAGTVCGEFLTSLEVFPTLAVAAGAEPPPEVVLDGFDMLPVLQGKQPSPRSEMFWERRSNRAARVDHWKWVDSDRGGGLFDLEQDLGEQHDLSQEKPDVLARVKARFDNWKRAMEEAEPRGPFRDF